MELEKKNKFSWETLETVTIMNPEEVVAYLLYLSSVDKKNKKNVLSLLSAYVTRDTKKKEEANKCFQM